MEQTVQTINDIIDAVNGIFQQYGSVIEIAEIVLYVVLMRKFRHFNKATEQNVSAGNEVVTETRQQQKESKKLSRQLCNEFSRGLTLYLSGKAVEDMTDEEKAIFERVKTYMEVEQNVCNESSPA